MSKRKLGDKVGLRPSTKTLPSRKGKICSSRAHRGKYGPFEDKECGPNFLLIKARKSLELSRASAAEKLNVEEQELGRWERGECLPYEENLLSICDGYGMSAEELGYGALEEFYLNKSRDSEGRSMLIDKHGEKDVRKYSDNLFSERRRMG